MMMVMMKKEGEEEGEEEGKRRRGGRRRGEGEELTLKSSNPNLTGGELPYCRKTPPSKK